MSTTSISALTEKLSTIIRPKDRLARFTRIAGSFLHLLGIYVIIIKKIYLKYLFTGIHTRLIIIIIIIMRFSLDQFTLAAAVLATVASATPLSKRDKSFTIKQVSAHSRSGRKHGPAAKAYAYHRYGKLVSTHLHDAAVKAAVNAPTARKNYKTSQKTLKGSKASVKAADSSEVDADPTSDDNEYISPITVGGQPVNLQFDTGSSDL